MSAESNEAKPSIDDILSSIRQMIAEEHSGEENSSSPQSNGSAHAAGANGTRGHEAVEDDTEPAEEVLDLSEEFIVTDAAAGHQEQQPATQNEPEGSAAVAADASDIGEATQADTDEIPSDEPAEVEAADVWTRDFQMPVGESGPASPFAAARTHPESAWPGDDPFDVTDLYSRARSQSPHHRPEEQATHEDRHYSQAGSTPEADQSARAHEPDPQPEDASAQQGIELASLSTQTGDVDADAQADAIEPEDHGITGGDGEQAPAVSRGLHAVAEIEAAFGMPTSGWGALEQAESAEPGESVDEEQPQQAYDNAETGVGALAEVAEAETSAEQRGYDEDDVDQGDDPRGLVSVSFSQEEADHEDAAYAETETAPLATEPQHEAALFQQPAVTTSSPPAPPSHAFGSSGSPTSKTLEDSVKELLRPMLQEWLDNNMPRLVEAAMREQMAASQKRESPAPEETGDDPEPTGRRYGTQR